MAEFVLLPDCSIDDDFYHAREGFYAGESWRMHLFERVRADLDHVQRVTFSGTDEYHREHHGDRH